MLTLQEVSDCLIDKACVPCQGGIPPLSLDQATQLLSKLGNNWSLNESGYLSKTYSFQDFITAMEFANKIATLSEKEGHHPELIIGWGYCNIILWTHKINGLTESDFILAAKIEALK
ncbi:MAG: 4a-hydroxytetrahydrobiopterin dehydratase [Alphaproteobacteria bacterium]|nr:4a-hydroxytetrahydrobiopterin dehydratase [Alphaproteobacteria bacterium]